MIEHALAGPIVAELDHDRGESDWRRFDAEEDVNAIPSDGGDLVMSDIAAAIQHAAEIYPPAPSGRRARLEKLLDEISEGIAAKLRDDPRYWRTINALADTLVNHPLHRLDGDEATDIMRAAWNAS